MFSATKFVAAGAIVALFSGFLLTGILTQQQGEEQLPVAGASASTDADPTPATTAQTGTTSTDELLPGVALVTEEVEPGVLRVLSDGFRDLSRPVDEQELQGSGIYGYVPSSKIRVGPRGSVWVFGPEEFFRMGEEPSHRAPKRLGAVEVGPDGILWALVRGSGQLAGRRLQDLQKFDGNKWDIKATRILDFDLAPDGSVWVVIAGDDSPVLTRVAKGGWKKLRTTDWRDWDARQELDSDMFRGRRYEGFAISPQAIADGQDGGLVGWLYLEAGGRGSLEPIGFGSGRVGIGSDPTPESDAGAFGIGSDGTTWVYLGFEQPVLAGGSLETESLRYLARIDSTSFDEDGPTQTVYEYRGPLDLGSLAVAPDGSVWLTGDDGLVRFDGETWTWYLRGNVIEDLDIAPDGTVWVQAAAVTLVGPERRFVSEPHGTVETYVIRPEAAATVE